MSLANFLGNKITVGETLLALAVTNAGYVPVILENIKLRRDRKEAVYLLLKQEQTIHILKETSHFLMENVTPTVLTELEGRLEFWSLVTDNQG